MYFLQLNFFLFLLFSCCYGFDGLVYGFLQLQNWNSITTTLSIDDSKC